jgi:hypothetical protein
MISTQFIYAGSQRNGFPESAKEYLLSGFFHSTIAREHTGLHHE